jgi:hypothetical protein
MSWGGYLILSAAVAAACSNDAGSPPSGSEAGAGGSDAGAEHTPSVGGGAAGSADEPGAGGQALGGESTGGMGNGGSSGAREPNAGNDPGGTTGEAGSGGANDPVGPFITCPALGDRLELQPNDIELTEDQIALANAFGCELTDSTGRNFTVERFEVPETIFEVLTSPYHIENYDQFTVRPDCGPLGYLTPFAFSELQNLYAETLTPGIYTRVSCELNMMVFDEPVPPAPVNVDCAHAKPLPRSTSSYPDEPTAVLDETRVGDDQARFYSFSLPSDPSFPDETWDVTINTSYSYEGAGGANVKLSGLDNDYENIADIFKLDGEQAASFDAVSPGDYCLEFSVRKGVKYSIYYQARPTPL